MPIIIELLTVFNFMVDSLTTHHYYTPQCGDHTTHHFTCSRFIDVNLFLFLNVLTFLMSENRKMLKCVSKC